MPRLDPAVVRRLVGALAKRDDHDEEPQPVKVAPTGGFVVRFRSRLTGEVWEFSREKRQ